MELKPVTVAHDKAAEAALKEAVRKFKVAHASFSTPPTTMTSSSSDESLATQAVAEAHKALVALLEALQKKYPTNPKNTTVTKHLQDLTASQKLLNEAGTDNEKITTALQSANDSIDAAQQFLIPPTIEEMK